MQLKWLLVKNEMCKWTHTCMKGKVNSHKAHGDTFAMSPQEQGRLRSFLVPSQRTLGTVEPSNRVAASLPARV